MRFSKLAIVASFAAAIWGTNSNAQELRQPTQVQNTALNYSYYEQPEAQASPSDIAPSAGPATCAAPGGDCGCDDGCCDRCSIWPCGCLLADLGEQNKWFDGCFTQCRGITAGGWVAQSYTANPYRPVDKFNGPVTWTDRSNEYQLNELYGFFGKAAKTDGCGWDYGYRMDAMYGTNYRWNTSGGVENHINNGQFYGAAFTQAYGEVAYNDLSVKVGKFYSPVGYYVVGTANNFFPVLPYTFQYGEPFTQTGALATYKVGDKLTVGGGVTHGWDASDNTANPHAGGLLTSTYTIDEQRSLAYVGVFGPEVNASGVNRAGNGFGYTSRYLQTLVYSKKISDDVLWVLQSDFGVQNDALVAGKRAEWYGLNTYLYWNMTCRCQWGLNAEWFRDQGGYRVGQVLPSFGSPNARGLARGNFDGSFYRITFGPKYFFTPNLYTRVALLADLYNGKRNGGGLLPFDDGNKAMQQIGVFDLVYTF